ncbi:NADP-dependent oxidoreductase [Halomonas sp. McH1-25]|uniref:NADP-dependent oxidoreductase n=1 Tax=unclassified Halomonas TaxID=2609666 RepID=UPI001EF736D9|nr:MULTISPECIES: NADP-dependent oxidoreductase [unclassified Halomonas]MCG7599921.1 NADP-dependent oxidoreductase [Halomonas sp. McH1-25]MCP1342612.1 NADP-dependent oxidoreductase [Halomonas sp. FL8]MCP1361327.1 NADP-dependent oxidoreductase [Halomonas sp. BBD45]MCP1364916.1 NADP-dependent oxidoreductase [Halomonas sp. BBD48]
MKAITYGRYGEPGDILELTEQPMPKVPPGEVCIRVRSVAVNPVDWKIMGGHLDEVMPTFFPVIPGWDVAGVVESVGFDTPQFQPGDEVIAYARKDFVHGGTFAEFTSVPARAVARKPATLDWDQAAGLPLAGLTAYQLLTRLELSQDDTVLVHAAAGGVGSFAVQIARSQGARVIGTASEKNHDYLRELGAEPVTYGEGLAERVRELAPDGVDLAVDFVGGVLDVTRTVLRDGGRHGSIVDPSVTEAGGLWAWVHPDGEDLQALADLVDQGKVTVNVAETFPLEQAAEAFRLNQGGHVRGKVVVRVSR